MNTTQFYVALKSPVSKHQFEDAATKPELQYAVETDATLKPDTQMLQATMQVARAIYGNPSSDQVANVKSAYVLLKAAHIPRQEAAQTAPAPTHIAG